MPRFLERDEAIRRKPHPKYAWDGVGDVRAFWYRFDNPVGAGAAQGYPLATDRALPDHCRRYNHLGNHYKIDLGFSHKAQPEMRF